MVSFFSSLKNQIPSRANSMTSSGWLGVYQYFSMQTYMKKQTYNMIIQSIIKNSLCEAPHL